MVNLNTPIPDQYIEFLVTNCFQSKNGDVWAILYPYKTARTDMEILDLVVGRDKWQNEYKRDSLNILQCGIGIKYGPSKYEPSVLSEWIWKWSNGTPTESFQDKGEYSDAFKRAGVMWGIGRDLYYMPEIMVRLAEDEYTLIEGVPKTTWKFRPWLWEWNVSIDRQCVIGIERVGNKRITRVNTQPYRKNIVWNNLWDDLMRERAEESGVVFTDETQTNETDNTVQEGHSYPF